STSLCTDLTTVPNCLTASIQVSVPWWTRSRPGGAWAWANYYSRPSCTPTRHWPVTRFTPDCTTVQSVAFGGGEGEEESEEAAQAQPMGIGGGLRACPCSQCAEADPRSGLLARLCGPPPSRSRKPSPPPSFSLPKCLNTPSPPPPPTTFTTTTWTVALLDVRTTTAALCCCLSFPFPLSHSPVPFQHKHKQTLPHACLFDRASPYRSPCILRRITCLGPAPPSNVTVALSLDLVLDSSTSIELPSLFT
ncbi:hypothetical protein IAQ61_005918, partial [Plenodomus lingam]|uniref:uncharacterized protein n=1 Tax=Leptosphaeria maculans TaxID=5022 RepID=UPI003316D43A